MRLLVATTNPHKLREIRAILAGLEVAVEGLDAVAPIPAPDEHGLTFEENARAKAAYYADATGETVVAEDSGLEIDALDGAPGVHSARFGLPAAVAYPDKIGLIYRALRERGRERSPARFVCALALASPGQVLFETRAAVEGTIADGPRGAGGFGYDPILFYPPLGRTLAELTADEKADVSHRGKAFRALRAFLQTHVTSPEPHAGCGGRGDQR